MREQIMEVLERLKNCMARADRRASEVAESDELLHQYYLGKYLAYHVGVTWLEIVLAKVDEDDLAEEEEVDEADFEDEDDLEEEDEEWDDDFEDDLEEEEWDDEVGYNPYMGCFDMDC